MAKKKYKTGEKSPSFPFYVRDFYSDMAPLSASTVGIWSKLLCLMYLNPKRGVFSGTADQIMRACGTNLEEICKFFEENLIHKFADVRNLPDNFREISATFPGNFQIINRRMVRERKAKEKERLRKGGLPDDDESLNENPENVDDETINHPVLSGTFPGNFRAKNPLPSSSSSFSSSEDPPTPFSKSIIADRPENDFPAVCVPSGPTKLESMIGWYNEICGAAGMPEASEMLLSPDEMHIAGECYDEHPESWWKEFFTSVTRMPALCKGTGRWRGASFPWLLGTANMRKVLRGDYLPGREEGMKAVAAEISSKIGTILEAYRTKKQDALELTAEARSVVLSEAFKQKLSFIVSKPEGRFTRILEVCQEIGDSAGELS